MKLWSKEVLSVGGIYALAESFLSYCNLNFLADVLGLLFLLCIVLLIMDKMPAFYARFIRKNTGLIYYLSSFGWVSYIKLILILGLALVAYMNLELEEGVYAVAAGIGSVLRFAIIVSLVVAFIRREIIKKKKA